VDYFQAIRVDAVGQVPGTYAPNKELFRIGPSLEC
jgi:hypothetical protein